MAIALSLENYNDLRNTQQG